MIRKIIDRYSKDKDYWYVGIYNEPSRAEALEVVFYAMIPLYAILFTAMHFAMKNHHVVKQVCSCCSN